MGPTISYYRGMVAVLLLEAMAISGTNIALSYPLSKLLRCALIHPVADAKLPGRVSQLQSGATGRSLSKAEKLEVGFFPSRNLYS